MRSNYTDKEIVEGIKNDDNETLAFLYRENFHAVAYFIYNNSGTEQDAKDICQDAVILFYEKVKSANFELNCSVKTYLYAVCRRLWLKRLYYKSKFSGKIDEYEDILTVEEVRDVESKELDFKKMESAMGSLGEPCKTLLEDYYIKELSMTELSEKFGYTNADNAKNQKYKCLMRLKKLFFTA